MDADAVMKLAQCTAKCPQKHAGDHAGLQQCMKDCSENNGAEGIQAMQVTMLLVTVLAMFMAAKIFFKWRINSV
jgi:hypothetical protein